MMYPFSLHFNIFSSLLHLHRLSTSRLRGRVPCRVGAKGPDVHLATGAGAYGIHHHGQEGLLMLLVPNCWSHAEWFGVQTSGRNLMLMLIMFFGDSGSFYVGICSFCWALVFCSSLPFFFWVGIFEHMWFWLWNRQAASFESAHQYHSTSNHSQDGNGTSHTRFPLYLSDCCAMIRPMMDNYDVGQLDKFWWPVTLKRKELTFIIANSLHLTSFQRPFCFMVANDLCSKRQVFHAKWATDPFTGLCEGDHELVGTGACIDPGLGPLHGQREGIHDDEFLGGLFFSHKNLDQMFIRHVQGQIIWNRMEDRLKLILSFEKLKRLL